MNDFALPGLAAGQGPAAQLAAIALATFVSEDLTCLAVGLLAASGELSLALGLIGCFVGIVLGDLGLWLLGRVGGRRLLRWPWLARLLPAQRLDQAAGWLDRRGGLAVLAARFLPGTRVPLYVAAGLIGRRPGRFALWVVLAALAWVPLLVLAVALSGGALAAPLRALLGPGWPGLLGAAAALFLLIRLAPRLLRRAGRARLARLAHHEFWPTWALYAPLLPYLAWLGLRHRGLLVWTAANPGLPAGGGIVGESKFAILQKLPREGAVPSALLPAGELVGRLRALDGAVVAGGWAYPLILKPDAGQRGAGVRRVADRIDAEKYLQKVAGPVLAQPYHPGPFEAGVFYYRLPGEDKGHVLSITDKVFPVVAGDGGSTLAELVWAHPRYRLQAETFLARHAAQEGRVLAPGERLALALAGNHCQGTLFRDGEHLRTPELERAVDELARAVPGFFIGRFDIRYSDPDAFRAGRDLAVVELNGVTGEPTNLYDPSWSLWSAYRLLSRQWALLYRIGAANRAAGARPLTARAVLGLVRDFLLRPPVEALSD
jgi:membrane protein DedA with SNARE-associated domain